MFLIASSSVNPLSSGCPGKSHDREYPGTYNAQRDSLRGYWRGQFGYAHGIVVMNGFYEHVKRHRMEGRALRLGEKEENVIFEFLPEPAERMLVACVWSRWSAPGEPDLLSFAAITDEAPPEIAAAGHDRCIVPIKPGHVDAWLNPNPRDLKAQEAILADRDGSGRITSTGWRPDCNSSRWAASRR